MQKTYVFQIEKMHGYEIGKNSFTQTEEEVSSGRFLCQFEGRNITLQPLNYVGPKHDGNIIYKYDTGYQNDLYQGKDDHPGNDVLAIYQVKGRYSASCEEVTFYKNNKVSFTVCGSGRPLISTSYGTLRPATSSEKFYDYDKAKRELEEENTPKGFNSSFANYNRILT